MSSHQRPTNALGEFLRARRDELDPAEFGLRTSSRSRRVPGLRREEVATLAAISTDYYSRLEQGRITPSAAVLNALCDALRLDNDQRSYLGELAGRAVSTPADGSSHRVRPQLQRLLDAMTGVPAFVFDQRLDILAWNALATSVYFDFELIEPEHRNYVHLMFTHPIFRARYVDWEPAARDSVATLRRSAAHIPGDKRLAELVERLGDQNSSFRKWWAAHEIVDSSVGTVVLKHPVAGELSLDWDTFVNDNDTTQRLMTMTAAPHSPTHQALQFLASWDGHHDHVVDHRTDQRRPGE